MEETAPMDYRLVCRTCLAPDSEFYKLDSPILIADDDVDEKPISFLECLHYCTRLSNNEENERLQLPIYICTECSASLQVSYNFIRNALEAHEILKQKLSECSPILQQHNSEKIVRKNGAVGEDDGSKSAGESVGIEGKKMRFRCKICNEKVETKKALKEHVKYHLDIISYCCQMCSFECKKRALLMDHYTLVHNKQATREQLKPQTKQTGILPIKKVEELDYEDPIMREMDKIHNPTIMEDCMQTNLQQPFKQEMDMQLFLTPSSSNASAAIGYAEAAAAATNESPNVSTGTTASMLVKNESEQYGAEQFNVAANELSVGNEFIVMADGTVEEVMGNGVVIEYINTADDGVTLDNGLVIDNIMQVANTTEINNPAESNIHMDVDDIIIEENMGAEASNSNMPQLSMSMSQPETIVQTLQNIEDELPPPSIISATNALTAKRIKCKICTNNFQTQDQLKTHMLSHNEIPHFFCDQCAFYTFFKIDLTQHYKTKHKLQPTQKQLQPKNKVRPTYEQPSDLKHVYACDLCLFETRIKSHLRRHYLSQHQEEATEVQLRPTIDEAVVLTEQDFAPPPDSPPKYRGKLLRPDYPKGLNCKKCSKVFYWRDKLKDHYRQHSFNDGNSLEDPEVNEDTPTATIHRNTIDNHMPGMSLLKNNAIQYQQHSIPTHHNTNNVTNIVLNTETMHSDNFNTNGQTGAMDAQAIVDAVVAEAQAQAQAEAEAVLMQQQMNMQMNAQAPDIIMDIPVAATISTSTVPMESSIDAVGLGGGGVCIQKQQSEPAVTVLTTGGGYACQQIPSDAIPQIVETETTIDNSELDFVFNDALFEDFEEEEENEDEENEDDGTDFQDLLLTSDDDFEDILHDQQQQAGSGANADGESLNASNYQPYCVHCNKKFLSQYQFENHMFVHRGLAPYRCEMCTNLYNTKRALIRHYRAVHKRMPTRDMIQAKGDKVVNDHTPIENLNLIEQKAVTLMCAKCPFESVELHIMQLHLNATHSLMDENYILQKLPFECPRCIRSYATKIRLLRHLERSHSMATIIQQQRSINNVRSQLEMQQKEQQQLQQQNEPYIDLKGIATATTTTNPTTTAAASSVPMALTPSSSSPNTSCGLGRLTHSYQINYNSNNNTNNVNDVGADNSYINNGDDDNFNVGAIENISGFGVGGYIDIESNNNIKNEINVLANERTSSTTPKISPLSTLISNMESEDNTQIIISNIRTTKHKRTPKQSQKTPKKKLTTKAPIKNRKGKKTLSKGENDVDDSIASCTINQPTSLHNHLVNKDGCLQLGDENKAQDKGGSQIEIKPNTGTISNTNITKETVAADISVTSNLSNKAKLVHLRLSERSLYQYKCDICQCNYKTIELLKHHMKRHTARKFRCNYCPKRYINSTELKAHLLTHTGEKPHTCDLCPKRFRYSYHLTRHHNISHLGKRARCPVEGCGREFTTKAQLKIHRWKHDGNEPYSCNYCRLYFKKREALRRHTRRIHKRNLTEEEIAEIYRKNVGHTNPHDFTVSLSDGQMLRRSDLEQVAQRSQQQNQNDLTEESKGAVASVTATQNASISSTDIKTENKNDLSPLLASNSDQSGNIKFEMDVVEDNEEATTSTTISASRHRTSLVMHEEAINTYMLPCLKEEHTEGLANLQSSGTF